jgi:photosynthetic reaction center cytochrome c subunit
MPAGALIGKPSLWKKSVAILALTITPILLAYGGSQTSAPQATPAASGHQSQPGANAPQQGTTPPPQEGQPHPQGERRGPNIPDTFTNLQVLPKDIKKQDLVNTMRGFSMQLGVRCTYCHQSMDNFASDAKDEKQSARLMLKMVAQINADYISKVPDMPAPVTCWTCHRGKGHPDVFVPPAPGAPGAGGPPRPGEAAPQGQLPPGTPPAGTQPSRPPK